MVILKNDLQTVFNHDFVSLYLKGKEPNCTLYSQEGVKFSIHKEILYQSKLMKNILRDLNNFCCKDIEIVCPCSEIELESMITFLYTGSFIYYENTNINEFINITTKLFGFPDRLFSIEHHSDASIKTNLGMKKEFENVYQESNKTHTRVSGDKFKAIDSDPLSCDDIAYDLNTERKYKVQNQNTPLQLKTKQSDAKGTSDQNVVIYDDTVQYSCYLCYAKFKRNSHLKRHIFNVHKGQNPFSCSSCNESFRLKRSLKEHCVTIHKEKKPFQCDFCDKSFSKKSKLNLHISLPHSHLCTDCRKKFRSKVQLKKHILTVHVDNVKYSCNICYAILKTEHSLSRHIETIHGEKNLFECSTCNETFKFEYTFVKHNVTIHKEKKPFICGVCKKGYMAASRLKEHELLDHAFPCKMCDNIFPSEDQMLKHNSLIHKENSSMSKLKQLSCNICKIQYDSKQSLQIHIESLHEIDNPRKCKVCNKEFEKFKRHVLEVHEISEQYQCNKCDISFKRKTNLKCHISLDHCYLCSVCDKKFVMKIHLEKHNALVHQNTIFLTDSR